ncbi:CHAT domain-containing protein [Kitasatospora acidiphila]|uniref:CHAT domain-containing protein n=2 Tax=Kitasatospora acidiphila TaxID=2567942 RepID=A0A540W1L9_9ACTN|nr:CHAT domain-containing protein [Kitasatospora acidiphila]
MSEMSAAFRAAVREAMAAPDDGLPFLSDEPEGVLSQEPHFLMASILYDARERLTPDQAGGPEGVDLETVFLAACYYLARVNRLPEGGSEWEHHTFVFLFAVVHALRPDAVPQVLREAFEKDPPQLVPAYEILHAAGNALCLASEAASDAEGVALAAALMIEALEGARGRESEAPIGVNLGTVFTVLAELGGDGVPEGLRAAALHHMREALALVPLGDPSREPMLALIAWAQAKAPSVAVYEGSIGVEMEQYHRDPDPARLDAMINGLRATVATAAEPGRTLRRVELGQVLRMRFEINGDLDDLDESISELTDALAGPLNDEQRASACSFLGLAYLDRYGSLGAPADLEAASAAVRDGQTTGTAASPAHSQRLTNLAGVLTTRFDAYGDPAELDEAVAHLRHAVAVTPPSQQDYPVMLVKLAVALRKRGMHTGRDEDLATAEAILRQVAGQPSDTGLTQPIARVELSGLLAVRGLSRNTGADLVDTVTQSRVTALAPTQDVRTRLYGAEMWAMSCVLLGDLAQAHTAYGVALNDLLPKLAGRTLNRAAQEVRLRLVGALANDAAAVEITAGRPREALIRLEQGRGVLLAQALQLRGRHDDLRAAAPGLAQRFERVCEELVEQQGGREERKASAAAFEEVVRQIRALPGFADFHQPPDWKHLRQSAAQGPVAVVNVSRARCDVLLLRRRFGRAVIEVLPLPDVTVQEINSRTVTFRATVAKLTTPGTPAGEKYRYDREMKQTLRWLGETVVCPVLDRLGFDRPARPGKPLPRLWWCLTGALSQLPLHAAILDTPEPHQRPTPVYAHDRVVSSYVPTLSSLLHARARFAPDNVRASLLAVAVDAGSPYPRLTALDDELAATDQLPGPRSELRHTDATPDAVLAALRTHSHAHLACHGVRNPSDPSNSRLLLHNGSLTLRQLASERLLDAEFAYLSACHSAAPGEELANEAISVASAFQLCGYRQVIGSLWTVEDGMGPLLAREVYRRLAAAGAPDVARVLHQAVGALRGHPRYGEPLFWASMIHSGP